MILLIIIGFIFLIWLIGKGEENVRINQIVEERRELEAKGKPKLEEYYRSKGLPNPLRHDSVKVVSDTYEKTGYHYWNCDKKNLVLCPQTWYSKSNQDKSFSAILWVIPCDSILYFSKDGQIEYTNEITNRGTGGMSVSGAVIGGVVGGAAGAIIGAKNNAVVLHNKTVEHDNVHTYLYYRDAFGNVKMIDVEGNGFYSELVRVIPTKEYAYVARQERLATNSNAQESIADRFKQLEQLRDMNLVSDEEYNTKKAELMKML